MAALKQRKVSSNCVSTIKTVKRTKNHHPTSQKNIVEIAQSLLRWTCLHCKTSSLKCLIASTNCRCRAPWNHLMTVIKSAGWHLQCAHRATMQMRSLWSEATHSTRWASKGVSRWAMCEVRWISRPHPRTLLSPGIRNCWIRWAWWAIKKALSSTSEECRLTTSLDSKTWSRSWVTRSIKLTSTRARSVIRSQSCRKKWLSSNHMLKRWQTIRTCRLWPQLKPS